MIELFKRHVREERLANAEGRVMEGHHLDFEDNSFDFCGSQFGVMLFDKQAEALKEMVRVCKKGGKVFLIAYGAYQEMEFLNFFINSIQQLRPEFEGIPADHPPLEFQVSDPKVLESRLRDAGLRQVRVLQRTEKLEFQSAQQLWDWILYGNPIPGQILKNLDISTDETKVVRAQIGTLLEERKRSQGAPILTNPINIGYGIK
jgi:SAM-dependent methyltransferase